MYFNVFPCCFEAKSDSLQGAASEGVEDALIDDRVEAAL